VFDPHASRVKLHEPQIEIEIKLLHFMMTHAQNSFCTLSKSMIAVTKSGPGFAKLVRAGCVGCQATRLPRLGGSDNSTRQIPA